jgi:NAD(P)H-flavin reductase
LDGSEKAALLGPLADAGKLVITADDGKGAPRGFITDFLDPGSYAAVYACGPVPMLMAVKERCAGTGTPCFISMERRMACGVGACLGCRVSAAGGNRRCCADGPVFPAGEVGFDDF